MTGYQEILTDPSYQGQLVCLTAPHVGIVGVNDLDAEASKPQAQALILRDLARSYHNWRARADLAQYCAKHAITGITEIDTRRLTRILRDHGAVNGCICNGTDAAEAIAAAKAAPAMLGNALGKSAGTTKQVAWSQAKWELEDNNYLETSNSGAKIAVLDCGSKYAIMRELAERGCQVTVLPYKTTLAQLQHKYAGVVLSNGPGDPQPLAEAVDLAKELLANNIPTLGICLGHQVLAQACGAKIFKMKFGHHGANHPVQNLTSKHVLISSQNHGFAVSAEDLPAELAVTHKSLFDGSIVGIKHTSKPALGCQGHPEASPGPRELAHIFDDFVAMVAKHA